MIRPLDQLAHRTLSLCVPDAMMTSYTKEVFQMARVVFNNCFGGFSLSNEAMDRMVELGYHLEPNPKYNSNTKSKYDDKSQKYECWGYVDCPRHHPILVQVVEELGEKASGNCANLQIEEVEGLYRIDEYDGNETVVAPDGYNWENANEFIV